MRRVRILPFMIMVILGIPGIAGSQQPAQVTIQDFEFRPGVLRVPLGGSARPEVRWQNNGPSVHLIAGARNAFRSSQLARGASFAFTFTREGTYDYQCEIHPAMRGQVVVEASSDTGNPGDGGGYGGGY